MPTATLVPNGLTDSNSNVFAGAYTDIDNSIASASGTTLDSVTDEWTGGAGTACAFSFTMTNLPAAALSVNSVQFRVRARVTGTATTDLTRYTCDVSGTNAPSTTAKWTESNAGGGFSNKGAASGVTSSATVSEVNSWVVRVYQTLYSTEGGGDGLNLEIDEIEIIVDYNDTPPDPPAPGPSGVSYSVLPTADTAIYGLCIAQARDFVILGGLDTDRYSIRWSAIGDETDWPSPATDDARSKQSGSQSFPTKFGYVTGLAGDDFALLIFQESAVWQANYTGGDVVWAFNLLDETRGCVRQGRLVKVSNFVLFQSNHGYHIVKDGVITDIGYGVVDDTFN